MKNNLFFVANNFETATKVAAKVADFFAMRLFNTVEMFEFDNAPRKIDEVERDFGTPYVKKEMRSVIKMGLDFDETVIVANFEHLDWFKDLYEKISEKCLVIYLKENLEDFDEKFKQTKLDFLMTACDIALDAKDKSPKEISEETIFEITKFYNIEV